MNKEKAGRIAPPKPSFKVGDRVRTPGKDSVEAVVVNVGEKSILVRFEPGEALGIYPHGVLGYHEEEVS